ncbi:MAG: hybrid sensor histidine kinase/response regulator [Desulfobacterales bacterium]|nr:hybrid sensor histidine kinase/response regulator [Desulfobacterales bacterium]
MKHAFNTRILVIDDEETIRDSFREILLPRKRDALALEEASANLFDEEVPSVSVRRSGSVFDFEVEEASTGQQGLVMVQKALAEKRPFAVIFVDMRMPGWDGLKTVQHIRKFDERAEIIFVTAYSDYSIEDVVEKAGTNVSYHCKPFSVEEIRQIATKAAYEWNKARNLEDLIETIAFLRAQRWQLEPLLNNVLHQVAGMVGALSAMLATRDNEKRYIKLNSIGRLTDDTISNKYLQALPELLEQQVYQTEDFAYFQVEKYGILALFDNTESPLNNERLYIVRLFLEQAAQAIANVELQETLMGKEKLSAVGQAISMIAHDLRGPIDAICQGIELSEEMAEHREFVKEMHQSMLIEAKKSLSMVNDILDFTRNSQLTKTEVDVRPLLESLQKDTEPLLEELDIPLKIELKRPFYFPADESKILRVLVNLIKNSVEAIKQHKTVSPQILLLAEPGNDGFLFRVEDNGPGIPEQVKNQLFNPFVSYGKKAGTGLGLAIVRQFVEAHGGEISLETSSKGAKFTVFLPH